MGEVRSAASTTLRPRPLPFFFGGSSPCAFIADLNARSMPEPKGLKALVAAVRAFSPPHTSACAHVSRFAPGDRVGLLAANSTLYARAYFAILKAGVYTPLLPAD